MMIRLRFERGRILVEDGEVLLDGLKASNIFAAYRYREIIDHLNQRKQEFEDNALVKQRVANLNSDIKLRDYQQESIDKWRENKNRGIIVLPTGAGKTIVALKAIEELQASTLVVVPTLVLVDQWRKVLGEAYKVEIGALGGGKEDIKPLTVSTYDSASLRSRKLGNIFELIIFDEIHHLPAPSYRRVATRYLAPYRLGLTATPPSDEGAVELLDEIVGRVVYRLGVEDLVGEHLSEYAVKTVRLPLTPEEKLEYDRLYGVYRDFLRRRNIRIRSARDYMRFVQRSGRDPEARRALLSRNRAMDTAFNSESKIAYLKSLLSANSEDKSIIFTNNNKLVYRLSKEMLIPAITHQTPREEREDILSKFHTGTYLRILTSRVLDEGVDVPDASMGVIVSGSGSSRQFVQRLGRILRKKPGKQAVLFELVSVGTAETYISQRRRRS